MGSRVECKCGNVIYTGSFPNENVYDVISEEAYDEVLDPFDRAKAEQLFSGGKKLLECDKCGRILIQDKSEIIFYKKDD